MIGSPQAHRPSDPPPPRRSQVGCGVVVSPRRMIARRCLDRALLHWPIVTPPAGPSSLPTRYYLPTMGERLRLMGWRNVLWLPPLAVLIWIGLSLRHGFAGLWSLAYWWKAIVFAFAIPLAAAIRTTATALSKRSDPFCIYCGYSLTGLPHPPGMRFTCPECGGEVDAAESQEYARDPHWFIQRRSARHPTDTGFAAGAIREDNPDRL